MTYIKSAARAPGALLLVYYLVLALLLVTSTAGLVSVYQVVRAMSFTPVEGVILGQDISRVKRHSGQHRTSRTKYLRVSYSYEVDGKSYENHRIHAGTFGMSSGSDYKNYGKRFTSGTRVTVHVDPGDPQNAVLLQGFSNVTLLLGVVAGFLLLPTLFLRAIVAHSGTDQTAAAAP